MSIQREDCPGMADAQLLLICSFVVNGSAIGGLCNSFYVLFHTAGKQSWTLYTSGVPRAWKSHLRSGIGHRDCTQIVVWRGKAIWLR